MCNLHCLIQFSAVFQNKYLTWPLSDAIAGKKDNPEATQ